MAQPVSGDLALQRDCQWWFDSRLVLLQSVVDRIVPQSIKAVEPKNKFTRAIQHTYLLVSVDMAGLPGMAQVLAVFHTTFHTLRHGEV